MILIAGNAGHGKDSLGGYLKESFEPWCGVRQDAFAFTLKAIAHQTMGTPWHILNGDKTVKEGNYFQVAGDPTKRTIREGLQHIGGWFRDFFDVRIWANSVRLRAKNAGERVTIITDCRHPDEEIHWLRETCDFATLYFVRIRNPHVPVIRGHPSEDLIADVGDEHFDFIVENDGTLDDLRAAAREVASAVVMLNKTGKKGVKQKGDGWLVVDEHGNIPFEPQQTEAEAASLVTVLSEKQDGVPHRVIPSSYSHLRRFGRVR